jgi:hypothetical protein
VRTDVKGCGSVGCGGVRADIDINGVDEANEFNIGGYVRYNDDDDDNDGVGDVDDGYDEDGGPSQTSECREPVWLQPWVADL